MIKEVNPYCKLFQTYKTVLDDYEKQHPGLTFRMYLVKPDENNPLMKGGFTQNKYTTYISSGQIAGVIEEDEGNIPANMSVSILNTENLKIFDNNFIVIQIGSCVSKRR